MRDSMALGFTVKQLKFETQETTRPTGMFFRLPLKLFLK
jgi:hypothetical protein